MPTISRSRAALYVLLALCVLVLGGRYALGGKGQGPGAPGAGIAAAETLAPETGATDDVLADPPPTAATAKLVVHVVGAVRRPGLYRLPEGSRIDDAIRKAGGPTRRARLELVNLASPVSDGVQIVVPSRSDSDEHELAPGSPVAPDATVPARIRLSTATLEELDTLPGVGPVTAQRILDYREQHGPFTSVDELDAVPGIGPARLEQLRNLVEP